jgi:hypothetical protein
MFVCLTYRNRWPLLGIDLFEVEDRSWPKAAVAPSPIPAVRPYRGSAHAMLRRLRAVGARGNWVFASFTQDTPVRWRVSCGTLTAMTPHKFTNSAEGVERRKSRSPAMRNVYDAFICSLFRYPQDQLTVLPGAGIVGTFLPSEIPSKKFPGGEKSKLWRSNNYVSSRTCACRR